MPNLARGFVGATSPLPGGGAFGSRPAPISMPNPYGDLSQVYPNLSATNAGASGAELDKLNGKLSPDTINLIQNQSAEWGAANGMPGFQPGSLTWNKSLRDIGRTSEQEIQQGLQDYSPLVSSVSGTQTVNPGLQTEVNATNATNAAAPDPAAAASYAQSLFDKYLQQLSGPAGGTNSSSGAPWYAQGGNASIYTPTPIGGQTFGGTHFTRDGSIGGVI